jgi:hypothetical protein
MRLNRRIVDVDDVGGLAVSAALGVEFLGLADAVVFEMRGIGGIEGEDLAAGKESGRDERGRRGGLRSGFVEEEEEEEEEEEWMAGEMGFHGNGEKMPEGG